MDLVVECVAAVLFVAVSALCVLRNQHLFAASSTDLEASFHAFSGTSRFAALDGLRAFSVLAVIWTHVTGPHAVNLLNQGNKGVDLFFAISGFLVTNLLIREWRRDGSISLRNFFIRRTLRIFPLYYAVLSMYCVLVFATFRGTPKAAEFWQNFPAFATYTSNWFVNLDNGAEHGVTFYFAWSLATEEQFYLFWPPLLAAVL
jgi:peptidoglycan/LPS O-acetylase OafA/YrhL